MSVITIHFIPVVVDNLTFLKGRTFELLFESVSGLEGVSDIVS